VIVAGDLVVRGAAGGGGYGEPMERDPRRVGGDVDAGYVSRDRAEERYGVVLAADGAVNAAETVSLRARLAAARHRLTVVADERDPYEGAKGRHRVFRLTPSLAGVLGLSTGDLVELHGRHPAPLRGWIRLDPDAPADALSLDAFGRAVLGVNAGDTVELRRLEMPQIPGGMTHGAG